MAGGADESEGAGAALGEGKIMELLQFVFSGFYIFIGVLILISVTLHGLAQIILAIRGEGGCNCDSEDEED